MQRHRPRPRRGRPARATAVRPKWAWTMSNAVAAGGAARSAARAARSVARAGREREQLDLEPRRCAAAPPPGRRRSCRAPGCAGRRVHVGDDQRAHRGASLVPRERRVDPPPPRPLAPWSPCPRPAELPVAVFDSGVGGLTVLHELLVSLPSEDFVYLGDTARFPYGERTPAGAAGVRASRSPSSCSTPGAKLLVVACNSASAAALPTLRARTWSARPRRRRDRRRRARPPSWRSRDSAQRPDRAAGDAGDGGQRRLRAGGRAADPHVHARARWPARPGADHPGGLARSTSASCETVRGYCAPLRAAEVDTVILGCTHYPLVRADAPAHARAAA